MVLDKINAKRSFTQQCKAHQIVTSTPKATPTKTKTLIHIKIGSANDLYTPAHYGFAS